MVGHGQHAGHHAGHHTGQSAGTVADELAQVADALRSVDEALLAARRLTLDPRADAVAPDETGASLASALMLLSDRLGTTAEECGDGARALRGQIGDLT